MIRLLSSPKYFPMRIALHIPCMVDQWMPEIGVAMLRVFERLGHSVSYNPAQTCCGLPHKDVGDLGKAMSTAERQLGVFDDADAVVSPSAACAAMMRKSYPELFAGGPQESRARSLAARTHEFTHFLVGELGVIDVGARFEGTAAVQDCCKNPQAGCGKADCRRLLSKVRGLKLLETGPGDCCGFGGSFSVTHPELSVSMGLACVEAFSRAGARVIVTNDPGCLLQLRGLMGRHAHPLQGVHIAEVLASV